MNVTWRLYCTYYKAHHPRAPSAKQTSGVARRRRVTREKHGDARPSVWRWGTLRFAQVVVVGGGLKWWRVVGRGLKWRRTAGHEHQGVEEETCYRDRAWGKGGGGGGGEEMMAIEENVST